MARRNAKNQEVAPEWRWPAIRADADGHEGDANLAANRSLDTARKRIG